MTLTLNFPRARGAHSSRARGGHTASTYPIATHATTIADCMEALITDRGDSDRRYLGECVAHARREGVSVGYAAAWPADDGQSWRFVLIAQRNSMRWAEKRTLIVNADQYTALVSAMTDLRVPEVSS